MERWEYQTRFMEAKAKKREVRRFIKTSFGKRAKRYSPESLIPELNELGEEGWEVIHMEPVPRVGGKEDFRFFGDNWSNVYFVVLKRRKPTSYVPVQTVSASATPPASANGETPATADAPATAASAQANTGQPLPFDPVASGDGNPPPFNPNLDRSQP